MDHGMYVYWFNKNHSHIIIFDDIFFWRIGVDRIDEKHWITSKDFGKNNNNNNNLLMTRSQELNLILYNK